MAAGTRRRKKWKAPNNPTATARQVWGALFPGEPWPKGWRVQWAGFMRGAAGLCIYDERRVLLSYADARKIGPVSILLHEFVHMRCGRGFRHGPEFAGLVREFHARLGIEGVKINRAGHVGHDEPAPHRHRYAREVHNQNGYCYACSCGAVTIYPRRHPDFNGKPEPPTVAA